VDFYTGSSIATYNELEWLAKLKAVFPETYLQSLVDALNKLKRIQAVASPDDKILIRGALL